MAAELPQPGSKEDWRARMRRTGFCRDCGKPSPQKKARCAACLQKGHVYYRDKDKTRLSWKARVAKGLCRNCGKPNVEGGPRCPYCLKKERDKYHFRVVRGECVVCGVRSSAGAFCLRHWFRNIGSQYHLSKSNGGLAMLEELWKEQEGRCAVTGAVLTPGVDASLDHIVPISKGGLHTKSNLRWVLYTINIAKADLSHEEFVELCRAVVRAQCRTVPVAEIGTSANYRSN